MLFLAVSKGILKLEVSLLRYVSENGVEFFNLVFVVISQMNNLTNMLVDSKRLQ